VQLVEYPAIPLLSRGLNALVCARRLAPVVRASRPDLVLAYWVHPEGLAAVRLAHRIGVPAVVGAMGSDLRSIGGPLTRRSVSAALREADSVVTVSRDLREIALGLGARPDRVHAILNGCDGGVFRLAGRAAARHGLGVAADARLVLFVGRLSPAKGVRELLAAACAAASRLPTFELAVVGEGPLAGELQQRAAAGGLAGRVRFVGRCEPSEVARWLAAADALCLPSHSEGCPNAVLEALSCGRPVVASNVGGVPELVDETCGRLTPVGDPGALAEALLEVLGRDWNAAAIAASHARTWRDVARETWHVCEPLLGPGWPIEGSGRHSRAA
jgi:glycosyltransferase involved in cell wall biosynthesis